MALTKITKSGITGDVVDETLIADNAISEEHLDPTAVSGNTALGEAAASNDFLLIYDSSAGVLKKVQASNVGTQAVTLSSVSPTNALSGDGTGNHTFTITGTNLTGATAVLVTNSGTEVEFDTVTVDSSTQITGVIAKSSLSNANEPYDVRVYGSNGLQATLRNQINVDASPIFNTTSGSVGSFQEQTTISTIDIEAYDPDSAGNVTFEIQSGSLPAGLSATTVNENGVSKYRITGTLTADIASNTTSNFTLRAVDAASNTSSRAFSITETPYTSESFTSDGTFSVPSGVTSVNVLVVAGGGAGGKHHGSTSNYFDGGGGGGAGGLIYMPGYPVTPGGTVSVTVGCGGNGGDTSPESGQDSVFGTLTAKGGGRGASASSPGPGATPGTHPAAQGGSGGGANRSQTPVGQAIQPTQPGNSGAYGFGNPGSPLNITAGGGGGGAGAAGPSSVRSPNPGPACEGAGAPGGIGKAYTISDGTTPVYYAGGGGGGGGAACAPNVGGEGGQGGGAEGVASYSPGQANPNPTGAGNAGSANKGGGGGGAGGKGTSPLGSYRGGGGDGGKGIVIVNY